MGFRENLKAELTCQNMLVKELAVRSGVNKRTIDNYLRENGSDPSAEAAVLIARVLDVSTEYLVTGQETRRGRNLALSADVRSIAALIEQLAPGDRKFILSVVQFLKNRTKEALQTA
jgi:transcriptional regulator with XRE-family HTH domain